MQKIKAEIPSLKRNDWTIVFFNRLGFHPAMVFISICLFNFIVNLFLAIKFDAWAATPASPGFEKEPGGWAIDFVIQPLIFACYVWVNNGTDLLLKELLNKNALIFKQNSLAVLNTIRQRINSIWFSVFSFLSGVLILTGVTYFLISDPANHTWQKSHIVIFYTRTLIGLPVYVTGVKLIIYMAFFLFGFNKLVRLNGVNVQLFHSDNAGGWGSVGQFISNFGYFVLGFGVALLLMTYQAYLNVQYFTFNASQDPWSVGSALSFLVYAIVALLSFIIPVNSTHFEMVKFKNNLLDKLSIDTNKIMKKLNTNQNIQPELHEAFLEKLQQLERTRNMVLLYPTWPFNEGNVRKYFGLVSTPIITYILSIVQDEITRIIRS